MDKQIPNEGNNLQLLRELQGLLHKSLNSYSGHVSLERRHLMHSANSIAGGAEGFLVLREAKLFPASKVLIRPILESLLWSSIIARKRGVLFRKAYTEWSEEKKLRPAEEEAEAQAALQEMIASIKGEQPDYPIECKKVKLWDEAQILMMPSLRSIYGTYCNFTHATMHAAQGHLDEVTTPQDTIFVAWCVLMTLENLRLYTDVDVADLQPFWKRLPGDAEP